MRQLTFELNSPPSPTLDNFVVGRNAELLESLRQFLREDGTSRFIYIWGPEGVGKTHLIRAVGDVWNEKGNILLKGVPAFEDIGLDDNICVTIDDIDRLDENLQIYFFNLYNAIKESSARLVVSGKLPPSVLPLRADVNTRLSWGLVYQMHPLAESEKILAMKEYASSKGFKVPIEVISYVLAHYPRDMSSLLALLDGLDQYSIEVKRKITVPLVKDYVDMVS